MLAKLARLRDNVNVLTAIVQRLDNSHTRLLAEIRATQSAAAGLREDKPAAKVRRPVPHRKPLASARTLAWSKRHRLGGNRRCRSRSTM